VLFRDGPFSSGSIGKNVLTDGFTKISLTIRPEGNFDAEPYIALPVVTDPRIFQSFGDNRLTVPSNHGFEVGDLVRVTTTDTLPTGIEVATDYFVRELLELDGITLSATKGGAELVVTGTGSGTHRINTRGGDLVIDTQTIDGKPIAFFDLPSTTDAIEAAFALLNTSRGANPAARALSATGELVYTRNGDTISTDYFRVAILQDIDR
jgi:hypothetical protein